VRKLFALCYVPNHPHPTPNLPQPHQPHVTSTVSQRMGSETICAAQRIHSTQQRGDNGRSTVFPLGFWSSMYINGFPPRILVIDAHQQFPLCASGRQGIAAKTVESNSEDS
jgi:hypothetical protein